jgi:hypothetical protein
VHLFAAFLCAVALICLGVLPVHAEKRIALVIGNAAYRGTAPLPNPKNDAGRYGWGPEVYWLRDNP